MNELSTRPQRTRQLCTAAFLLAAVCQVTHASETLLHTTANPDIRQGYLDTPQGQLHYWTAGEGENLLLIHQSSSSVEEYAGMVPYLADRFRVITYDWPGHGQSDNPTKEYGVVEFTRSALAVLDHLDIDRTHVLGNHGGALIAMNLAWRHPERVDQMVLAGTSGVKTEEESKAFSESLDLERRNRVDREGKSISEAWGRYLDYMPNSTPEEILRPFVNNIVKRARPYDAHHGVLRWDRRPALKAIKKRHILLMQGERDIYVSNQETLLEILPNARRTVIPDAGVFQFYERPKESALVIRDYLVGASSD